MKTFLALCLLASAWAEVIDFNVELGPSFMVYRRVPMFGEDATPASGSPGDGTSYVTLDLEMSRISAGGSTADDAYVQVTVLTEEAFNEMGLEIDGEREFCCPNIGALDGKCPSTHALAVRDDAARKSSVALFLPPSEGAAEPTDGRFVSKVQTTIPLGHTGFYYIVFSSCTPNMAVVRVTGSTLWANPYGYIPANLYPLLPFYLAFTIAYLAAGALWGVLCVAHRDSVMTVQTMITGVLVLGLLDAASRYYEFTDMNKTGTRGPGVFIFALVFRCAKRTLSRALVLMVALGYGVSKPTLGTDFFKICGLSAVYLVAMVWSELIQAFVREESIPPSEFLLLFVIANLDVIFYFWIFRAIVVTSTVLERTRQQHKLTMYTYFRNVMVAAVAASLAWAVYYMVAAATGSLETMWQDQWMFDAFWEVLYFGLLVAIAVLWRPTEHSLRYAYMQELTMVDGGQHGEDDEDDEGGDAYLGDVAKEEEEIHAALDAELDGETSKQPPARNAHSGGLDAEHARLATGYSDSDDEDDLEDV